CSRREAAWQVEAAEEEKPRLTKPMCLALQSAPRGGRSGRIGRGRRGVLAENKGDSMKKGFWMTVLVAAILLAGCKKEDATPTPPSGSSSNTSAGTGNGTSGGTGVGTGSGTATTGPTTRGSATTQPTLGGATTRHMTR